MTRCSQGLVRALLLLVFFHVLCAAETNTQHHAGPGTITRSPITIVDTVTFHGAPTLPAAGAQPTGLSSSPDSADDSVQAQLDRQHQAASMRALKRFAPHPTPIIARVWTSIRLTFDALVVQLWPWFHPVETPTLPAPPPQIIYLLPAPPPAPVVLHAPPGPWWKQVLRVVSGPSLLQRVLLCLLFLSCAVTLATRRYGVPASLRWLVGRTSPSSKPHLRNFKRVPSISTDVARDAQAHERKVSRSGTSAETSRAFPHDEDDASPPRTPTRSMSSQESTPRSVRNSWASTTTPAGLSLAESIASFVSSDFGWQHINDGSASGSAVRVDDVFMSLKLRGSSVSPNSSPPASISQPLMDVSQVWEREGAKGRERDADDDWSGPRDRSKEDRAAAQVQLLFDAALAASEQWSQRSSDAVVVQELEEELGHQLEEIPSEEEREDDDVFSTPAAADADEQSILAVSFQPSDIDITAPPSPLETSTPPMTPPSTGRTSQESDASTSHQSCGLPVRRRGSNVGGRRRSSGGNSMASDDSFSADGVSSCSGSPSPGSVPSASASSPTTSPARPARSSRLPTPAKSTPLRSSASSKSTAPSPSTSASTSTSGPAPASPIPLRFPRATSESLESSWESVPSPFSPSHRRTDSQTRLPRRSLGARPASPSTETPPSSSSPSTQRLPSGQTRLPRRSVSSRVSRIEQSDD